MQLNHNLSSGLYEASSLVWMSAGLIIGQNWKDWRTAVWWENNLFLTSITGSPSYLCSIKETVLIITWDPTLVQMFNSGQIWCMWIRAADMWQFPNLSLSKWNHEKCVTYTMKISAQCFLTNDQLIDENTSSALHSVKWENVCLLSTVYMVTYILGWVSCSLLRSSKKVFINITFTCTGMDTPQHMVHKISVTTLPQLGSMKSETCPR